MASLTLRNVKGTPLTNTEIDDNFTNLNTELGTKLDSPDSNGIAIRTGTTTSISRSVVASGVGLTVANGTGVDGNITIVSSGTAANTPSTLVFRDSSGNFSANTITANLTGNVTGNLNGIIGAITPAAGTFTTLAVNTSISGVGFTNYFASPPALGSSVANTVRGTTVTATTTFTGPIGSAGANAGAFTTLSASGNTTLLSTLTVNGSVGTSVQVLKSRGAGQSPTWGAVSLASDVSGILSVGNGGTGATTQAGALANIVGFTPVQQGGGTGQLANKLFIGWSSGGLLRLQIDSTDFAGNWPINSRNVTEVVSTGNGGTGLTSPGTSGNVLMSNGTGWYSAEVPKGVPQTWTNTNYTLQLSDNSKHIRYTGGSATITIPTNASVPLPVGAAITIINDGSASITLATGGITAYLVGTSFTGNRVIAVRGAATILKVATDTWYISGAGLS